MVAATVCTEERSLINPATIGPVQCVVWGSRPRSRRDSSLWAERPGSVATRLWSHPDPAEGSVPAAGHGPACRPSNHRGHGERVIGPAAGPPPGPPPGPGPAPRDVTAAAGHRCRHATAERLSGYRGGSGLGGGSGALGYPGSTMKPGSATKICPISQQKGHKLALRARRGTAAPEAQHRAQAYRPVAPAPQARHATPREMAAQHPEDCAQAATTIHNRRPSYLEYEISFRV